MTATSLGKSTVSKCRALLDTGAGSSYASASLIDHLKIRPHQREVRQIEMMMGVVTKPVELFSLEPVPKEETYAKKQLNIPRRE